MKVGAESFSWPCRGQWKSRWGVGLVPVLLLPIAFVPLLGYAIAATREAEVRPATGPPRWELSGRLISDGLWTTAVVVLFTAPFLLLLNPLAGWLFDAHLFSRSDPPLPRLSPHPVAFFPLPLPSPLLLL